MHNYLPPFTDCTSTSLEVDTTGVVPFIEARLLLGEQQGSPNILNKPPVGVVSTQVLYLVLVLIPQAVTCLQFLLTSGYNCVPEPIVTYTGAFIVVASGID
jgi:hypothetical protein